MGCFSVPTCPNAHVEAQNNPRTSKNSLRIAGCEATEGAACCKGKTPRELRGEAVIRNPATCWLSPQVEMRASCTTAVTPGSFWVIKACAAAMVCHRLLAPTLSPSAAFTE